MQNTITDTCQEMYYMPQPPPAHYNHYVINNITRINDNIWAPSGGLLWNFHDNKILSQQKIFP